MLELIKYLGWLLLIIGVGWLIAQWIRLKRTENMDKLMEQYIASMILAKRKGKYGKPD